MGAVSRPVSVSRLWRASPAGGGRIERLGSQLSKSEIKLLFDEVASRLQENVNKINHQNEMVAKYPSLGKGEVEQWQIKQWSEEAELDRRNLQTLLPLLSEKERKMAKKLLQE